MLSSPSSSKFPGGFSQGVLQWDFCTEELKIQKFQFHQIMKIPRTSALKGSKSCPHRAADRTPPPYSSSPPYTLSSPSHSFLVLLICPSSPPPPPPPPPPPRPPPPLLIPPGRLLLDSSNCCIRRLPCVALTPPTLMKEEMAAVRCWTCLPVRTSAAATGARI